jgi:hypothetical protein
VLAATMETIWTRAVAPLATAFSYGFAQNASLFRGDLDNARQSGSVKDLWTNYP